MLRLHPETIDYKQIPHGKVKNLPCDEAAGSVRVTIVSSGSIADPLMRWHRQVVYNRESIVHPDYHTCPFAASKSDPC